MRRAILLLGLAAAAACGSDGPTPPPTNNGSASVLVDAPQIHLTVGATVQAAAKAFGADGKPLSGATFTWSSSNVSVASIDAKGIITAVAPGATTITATTGSVTGSLPVDVDVDRCATPLALGVGGVATLSGPAAVSCITIAASPQPSTFLFITANALPAQDDIRSYAVNGNVVGATFASMSATPRTPALALASQDGDLADAFEAKLRHKESQLFAGRSPSALMRSAEQVNPAIHMSVAAAALPRVGDTLTYRVPDANASDLCKTFATVRAVVKAVGSKALIVQDVAAPAGGFLDSDFSQLAAEFDNLIYKTDTLWFGSPTDIDKDGHITILYTPEINKLTPSGATGFIGGFFFGADLFPRSIPAQSYKCDQSNEQEIFYVLTPDPSGTINGNKRTTASVRQGTRGTIAHELQHMINQGVRMTTGAANLETSWLNEAMSHMAEEAVGRAARGFGDMQPLTNAEVRIDADDYAAFFQQNLLRLRSWMQRPDTSSPVSARAASQLAPRGAAWAFVRYTADHYSSGNPRQFFRRLAAGPQTDVTNLVARAGGVPFEEILKGWLVANHATGLAIPGLPAKYTYTSWAMRDATAGANSGVFPLLVTTLPAQVTTQSRSGSGNYFRLARAADSPPTTFRMLSASGGEVDFTSARVYVVRID